MTQDNQMKQVYLPKISYVFILQFITHKITLLLLLHYLFIYEKYIWKDYVDVIYIYIYIYIYLNIYIYIYIYILYIYYIHIIYIKYMTYFHQFHNNVNIKSQYFSIYGYSWPWVLGPLESWVLQLYSIRDSATGVFLRHLRNF